MDRPEWDWSIVGLIIVCVLLICLVAEIHDVWPVLARHLQSSGLIALVGGYVINLVLLGKVLINARKNAPSLAEAYFLTIFSIGNWLFGFFVMGQIGH